MRYHTLLAVIVAIPGLTMAENGMETPEEKASYGFGANYLRQLKAQGIELDIPAFTRGIEDAAADKNMAITEEEMKQAMKDFQTKLRADMQKKETETAAKNLAEGKAFLEKNAKKDGVVTTKSGLQYKILKAGTGKSPKRTDRVKVRYFGTLINGTPFDGSHRNRPTTTPVADYSVTKGWTEALQLMKVGAKWRLFVPSELAYGERRKSAKIAPHSVLIFEIELLEILPPGGN